MTMPQRILDAVAAWHEGYRHPRLPRPECSGIYSLFPQETASVAVSHQWPERWPHADRPGVYCLFGPDLELTYIGKAACLGLRLGAYFQYEQGRGSGCKIVHGGWKRRPTYLATVAIGEAFEAPALEEFLIGRLQPAENKLWVASVEQPDHALPATGEDVNG